MTTEADTRKSLIDGALRLAGWTVGDPSQVIEEYVVAVDPHSTKWSPWRSISSPESAHSTLGRG